MQRACFRKYCRTPSNRRWPFHASIARRRTPRDNFLNIQLIIELPTFTSLWVPMSMYIRSMMRPNLYIPLLLSLPPPFSMVVPAFTITPMGNSSSSLWRFQIQY